MTEQNGTAAVELPPEVEIGFMGRSIWVRMPKPEQLLVWRRTLVQLQDPQVKDWNGEQAMIALERTRKIIDSVMVHKADVVWLDDQMLDGVVGLKESAEIINKTVDKFAEYAEQERAENGTRAERRAAAKPGKKATRKRAKP